MKWILKYWTLLKYGKYVEYFKFDAEICCFSLSLAVSCSLEWMAMPSATEINIFEEEEEETKNQITTDSVDISLVKTNVIEFCMIINIEPFVFFIFYRFIILIIKNNITANHTITTTKYMYNCESDELISNSDLVGSLVFFVIFFFIGSSTLELSIWTYRQFIDPVNTLNLLLCFIDMCQMICVRVARHKISINEVHYIYCHSLAVYLPMQFSLRIVGIY